MGTTAAARTTMSEEEARRFRDEGFLGPFELCSPDEMIHVRADCERIIDSPPLPQTDQHHNRHLEYRELYDLVTRPEIVDRMAALYGPDLLLWRTNFFVKEPGAKAIPWHQDHNYWPLEPPVIISAWIAIDRTTVENGCLEIIPGSHRKVIPHVPSPPEMAFDIMADPTFYDATTAFKFEMEPGQFVLFNERTLHHSEPNRSQTRRMGLAVRVVVPMVRVIRYDAPTHGLVVIRGENRTGFNRVVEPPPG